MPKKKKNEFTHYQEFDPRKGAKIVVPKVKKQKKKALRDMDFDDVPGWNSLGMNLIAYGAVALVAFIAIAIVLGPYVS
jgi:hypothetical protein